MILLYIFRLKIAETNYSFIHFLTKNRQDNQSLHFFRLKTVELAKEEIDSRKTELFYQVHINFFYNVLPSERALSST